MNKLYFDVKKVLRAGGCERVRNTGGTHERWYSPITDRNFTVAFDFRSKKTLSDILENSGLKDLWDLVGKSPSFRKAVKAWKKSRAPGSDPDDPNVALG